MSLDTAKLSNYIGQTDPAQLSAYLLSVDKDLSNLFRATSVFYQFGTGSSYSVLTYTSTNYVWFPKVGAWNITNSLLYGGSGASYIGLQPNAGIWMGDAAFANAVFSVDQTGQLKAHAGRIGGWYIGATTLSSTNLIFDSANELIQNRDFVSGPSGQGWRIDKSLAEFQNVRIRGKVTNAAFERDVISAVGGNLLVCDADVLTVNMSSNDNATIIITSDTNFSVGDFLRIKDSVDDEWFGVTAVSHTTYTVTRDTASAYAVDSNPEWKAGTAIVNYGAPTEGLIFMTASAANAPHMDVVTHNGFPWSSTGLTTRMRIGNLNGFLGYTSDRYGIAIGEFGKSLKYDPTDGLVIQGTISASNIYTSTLTSCLIIASTLSATSISASTFTGITIDASIINTTSLSACTVNTSSLTSAAISASTVSASTINTSTLSACTISTTNILISNSGYMRSGQTNYNVGTGFWIGDVGGTPKFSIGNSATAQTLTWDGSILAVSNLQSTDYVSDTTGYKLSATTGLEINTGGIKTNFLYCRESRPTVVVWEVVTLGTTTSESYIDVAASQITLTTNANCSEIRMGTMIKTTTTGIAYANFVCGGSSTEVSTGETTYQWKEAIFSVSSSTSYDLKVQIKNVGDGSVTTGFTTYCENDKYYNKG